MNSMPDIEQWLKVARRDWQRIHRNLDAEDGSAAGFFLQQSIEKYLKAFLIQHGWQLRKIHDLESLLDEAINFMPSLANYYDLCERVSGYYFAERYPPLTGDEPSLTDIQADIEEAKSLILAMFPSEAL